MSAWDVQHRESLNKEFDQIFREHERLRNDLNGSENNHHDYQDLRRSIDEWEEKTVKKIRRRAKQARDDLQILFDLNRHYVRRTLEQNVSGELRETLAEKHPEFREADIDRWLAQLAELRKRFEQFSSNIDVNEGKSSIDVRPIHPLPSVDVPQMRFTTIRGRVQIDANRHLLSTSRRSAVISQASFSRGTHFFRFRVERSQADLFFGVIGVEDEEKFRRGDRPCLSVHGWWNIDRRVFADQPDSHVSALKIYTNDEVILTLNCQAKQITLEYPSMNKLNRIEMNDRKTSAWKMLVQFDPTASTSVRLLECGRQAHGNHREDQAVHCYCSAETPPT